MNIEAVSRLRVFNESVQIAARSKRVETKLSRCDVAIEHARALQRFEERGIHVCDPTPSQIKRRTEAFREEIIAEGLSLELRDAETKLAVTPAVRSKTTIISKALIRVHELRNKTNKPELADSIIKTLEGRMQREQLEGYVADGQRAELKGQKKQALGHYYDALYLLRHDGIDDALQASEIGGVEAKIRELGGELH